MKIKKLYAILITMLMLFPTIALAEQEQTCTDSDGGENIYEVGETTQTTPQSTDEQETIGGTFDACSFLNNPKGVLKEAICDGDTATHKEIICPDETPYCNRAVCSATPPKCTDTDNGNNPYVLGTITEPRTEDGPQHTDYCEDINTKQPVEFCSGENCGVREYFCTEPYVTTSYQDIFCPNGCQDGACIKETQQTHNIKLSVYEGVEAKGKQFFLYNVGSGGAIVVGFDEMSETIPASETEEVDGWEITNVESFYKNYKYDRYAIISIKIDGSVLTDYEKIAKPIPAETTTQPIPPTASAGGGGGVVSGALTNFKVNCNAGDELEKYPHPFLDQNYELTDFAIVVGSKAPASDTLAAVDIATNLQFTAKMPISTDDNTAYIPADITINTKLDTEITNKNQHLILIGHPKENILIGELMEFTGGKGHGLIKVFEYNGYTHLVVTGRDAIDRRRAAKVLANYDDYNIHGDKCEVIYKEEIPEPEQTFVPPKPEKYPEFQKNICGNGFCETDAGENSKTCPQDCKEIVTTLQCSGCIKDKECLPYGIRLGKNGEASYCDITKEFKTQKQAGDECANNFECESNICVDNECVSGGLLKKILNWFRRLFG